MTTADARYKGAVALFGLLLLATMGIYLAVKWAQQSPGLSVTATVFGVLVAIVLGAAVLANSLPHLLREKPKP